MITLLLSLRLYYHYYYYYYYYYYCCYYYYYYYSCDCCYYYYYYYYFLLLLLLPLQILNISSNISTGDNLDHPNPSSKTSKTSASSRGHIFIASDESADLANKSDSSSMQHRVSAAAQAESLVDDLTTRAAASKLFLSFQPGPHRNEEEILEQLEKPLTTLLAPWLRVSNGSANQPLEVLAAAAAAAHLSSKH
jgi:hypothetical protein